MIKKDGRILENFGLSIIRRGEYDLLIINDINKILLKADTLEVSFQKEIVFYGTINNSNFIISLSEIIERNNDNPYLIVQDINDKKYGIYACGNNFSEPFLLLGWYDKICYSFDGPSNLVFINDNKFSIYSENKILEMIGRKQVHIKAFFDNNSYIISKSIIGIDNPLAIVSKKSGKSVLDFKTANKLNKKVLILR